MSFDLILNLCWGLLGLVAWLCLITRTGDRCWRRRITVLLAIVALFPCISASDDLASLRHLAIPDGNAVVGGASTLLPMMLTALESSQTETSFVLLFALLACGSLLVLWFSEISRRTPVLAGRSPPILS